MLFFYSFFSGCTWQSSLKKKMDDVNVSFYIEVVGCSDILNQLVGIFPIQKHLKKKKLSFVSCFRFLIKYKVMIVRLNLMQKEKGTNIYVSCILPTYYFLIFKPIVWRLLASCNNWNKTKNACKEVQRIIQS